MKMKTIRNLPCIRKFFIYNFSVSGCSVASYCPHMSILL